MHGSLSMSVLEHTCRSVSWLHRHWDGDGVRLKEPNDALLKAVSHVSIARLGLKFEFCTDSLADALKSASPWSKSGISLVWAIWF